MSKHKRSDNNNSNSNKKHDSSIKQQSFPYNGAQLQVINNQLFGTIVDIVDNDKRVIIEYNNDRKAVDTECPRYSFELDEVRYIHESTVIEDEWLKGLKVGRLVGYISANNNNEVNNATYGNIQEINKDGTYKIKCNYNTNVEMSEKIHESKIFPLIDGLPLGIIAVLKVVDCYCYSSRKWVQSTDRYEIESFVEDNDYGYFRPGGTKIPLAYQITSKHQNFKVDEKVGYWNVLNRFDDYKMRTDSKDIDNYIKKNMLDEHANWRIGTIGEVIRHSNVNLYYVNETSVYFTDEFILPMVNNSFDWISMGNSVLFIDPSDSTDNGSGWHSGTLLNVQYPEEINRQRKELKVHSDNDSMSDVESESDSPETIPCEVYMPTFSVVSKEEKDGETTECQSIAPLGSHLLIGYSTSDEPHTFYEFIKINAAVGLLIGEDEVVSDTINAIGDSFVNLKKNRGWFSHTLIVPVDSDQSINWCKVGTIVDGRVTDAEHWQQMIIKDWKDGIIENENGEYVKELAPAYTHTPKP
jgi:hypothetical protein